MEARIETIALKAVENFQSSQEFHHEKIEFATDAYDEGKCSIQGKVAARYPKLRLDFLNEFLEPPIADDTNVVPNSSS